MKKFIICCLPAILCLQVSGQTPLTNFKKHKFYDNKTPNTTGKYVIIDFFATWCAPCVRSLSKLDSLQKQFNRNVQIIAVTKESRETLAAFLARRKELKNLSLPFIVDDSLLNNRFPHKLIPHEVILDPQGKLLTNTTAQSLTIASLTKLISGKVKNIFPEKKDMISFTTDRPLIENLTTNQMIKSQSILAGFLAGTGTRFGVKKDSLYDRYFFINMPLIELLQRSNNRPLSAPYRLEVADSSFITAVKTKSSEKKTDHLISYEITVPAGTPRKEVNRLMLADLESRFNLQTMVVSPLTEVTPATFLVVRERKQILSTD